MNKRRLAVMAMTVAILLSGCAEKSDAGLHEGYYSAEAAAEDKYGWKEFVTIYVRDGKIVTAEFNAKNASGFVKSWDTHYMRNMNAECGTYPNKYTRQYASDLLNKQDPDEVDAISGATHSHITFQLLAHSAIGQSIKGDAGVALVELPIAAEDEPDAEKDPAIEKAEPVAGEVAPVIQEDDAVTEEVKGKR